MITLITAVVIIILIILIATIILGNYGLMIVFKLLMCFKIQTDITTSRASMPQRRNIANTISRSMSLLKKMEVLHN